VTASSCCSSWMRPPCKERLYLAIAQARVMFVLGEAHVTSRLLRAGCALALRAVRGTLRCGPRWRFRIVRLVVAEFVERFTARLAGRHGWWRTQATAYIRGAKVVVPPIKTAQTGGRGCRARDWIVRRIRKAGRRQWQKESGYHHQARVENTIFRYKRILGDRLHARDSGAQSVETRLACDMLNRTFQLGMSASYAVKM
jgi:hypothetical protein